MMYFSFTGFMSPKCLGLFENICQNLLIFDKVSVSLYLTGGYWKYHPTLFGQICNKYYHKQDQIEDIRIKYSSSKNSIVINWKSRQFSFTDIVSIFLNCLLLKVTKVVSKQLPRGKISASQTEQLEHKLKIDKFLSTCSFYIIC